MFYNLFRLQKGKGIFSEVREKWINSNYNSEKHDFYHHEYVEYVVYCHCLQHKSILTKFSISLLGCKKPLIKSWYHPHSANAQICTLGRESKASVNFQ